MTSKPLPTVSSILLLGRKKQIFPKGQKGCGNIKSDFSGKTSSPVASTSVPKITRILQQNFQPETSALTNEQSMQHNQSCSHLQPISTTCASANLPVYNDVSTTHIPTSESTNGEVPTISIFDDRLSLKESPQSHKMLPSVSSIFYITQRRKVSHKEISPSVTYFKIPNNL